VSGWSALGIEFWAWTRMKPLPVHARYLWLGLYTSAPARRLVPGLFAGSVNLIAEEVNLDPDQTIDALDKLLEHQLIELDRERKLVRFTEFPDAHEAAHNASHVKGWWNRFTTVPACDLRNAHIRALRWLLDTRIAKMQAEKKTTRLIEEAWDETFGTIVVPAPRRRGVRRLAESDTSTAVQPSLFSSDAHVAMVVPSNPVPGSAGADLPPPGSLPGFVGVTSVVTANVTDSHSTLCPEPLRSTSASSSTENLDLSLSAGFDTHPTHTGTGTGTGIRSSSPDLRSESTPHAMSSTRPPKLALVPHPEHMSAGDLLNAFACVLPEVRMLPESTREGLWLALQRAIGEMDEAGHGAEDLRIAGRWCSKNADGPPRPIPAVHELTSAAFLQRAIEHGHECERVVAAKRAALADARKQLGFA
jgi:hypothetical protein